MSTFPASPAPAAARIRSVSPTFVSTAHSLRQVVSSRGGHRWMIELTYPPMHRETFAPLWAFINAQAGRAGSFDFVLPQHAPLGTWLGTPVVDGADQTGKEIAIKGFTASKTGVAKAGDFVRFAGNHKTYQVTGDANSNASGEATIVLNSALVASPADEAAVSTDRKMRCGLADDNADVDIDTTLLYRIKIQLMEVLY